MATIDRGATPSEGLTSVDMYVPAPEPSTPHIDYEIIAKMPVWDSNGIMIPLDHLYRNQKVIIVFIRNFLCYTAKEYVEDLAKIPPNYLWDANVRLVVIGCSEWKYIKAFKNETGFPYELYVDQEKNIFSALKLKNHSSVQGSIHSPHVKSSIFGGLIKSTWRAMLHGDYHGDIKQLGGQLIVGPGPQEHFFHIDNNMMDHTPINRLLAVAGVDQVSYEKHARVIQL